MFEKGMKLSYQPCLVTIVALDEETEIVRTSQGVSEDKVNGIVDMWKNDFKSW
jgi:hypothetical protein